jgi:hypothetical protein
MVRAAWIIALMLLACVACAAELGRMFFTPAQRATLDNARKQNIRAEISNDVEQPATPLPQNVSVNGVIRRSDGKSTIWLNNRMVGDHQTSGLSAAVGKNDNRVRLSVPESGRNVELKVGQSVEIVSGVIGESYLHRPAAKPDAKTTPAAEGGGTKVSKDAPAQAAEPLKPERGVQKRASRAIERDAADDARLNGGLEQK